MPADLWPALQAIGILFAGAVVLAGPFFIAELIAEHRRNQEHTHHEP